MKEEFRPLIYDGEEYGDFYEISNTGVLRNAKTKKPVKPAPNKKGVPCYCATIGRRKKYKQFRIPKAVAETFIPNPDGKEYVIHKDGDKSNNNEDNLFWATPEESTRHNIDIGVYRPPENNHLKKAVVMIDKDTMEHLMTFPSAGDAGEYLGDKNYRKHISACCTGERKTAYGYIWKFA